MDPFLCLVREWDEIFINFRWIAYSAANILLVKFNCMEELIYLSGSREMIASLWIKH